MTRYRVLPYKQGSRSAKALAEALGGKVLKLEGSKFKPKPDDVIINWGSSRSSLDTGFLPVAGNDPFWVGVCSNKLKFFLWIQEKDHLIIPQFWTNKEEIPNDESIYPIVCRTLLSSFGGAGIVIASCRDDLVDAPLYVRYVKKKDEYRVHVGVVESGEVNGPPEDHIPTIIAVQRKARRLEVPDEEVNWQVRNKDNGFVFVRNNVNPPEAVLDVARRALLATGLTFGAVDVIWNAHEQRAYVLEVNTAPGLEGQTVQDYVQFFKEW